MLIHLEKQAQIEAKTQVRSLLFDIAFIIILTKYFNYNNIFLIKNAIELPEYIKKNDHAIKLEKDK